MLKLLLMKQVFLGVMKSYKFARPIDLVLDEPEIQMFVGSSKSKMSSIAYNRINPIVLIGTKES